MPPPTWNTICQTSQQAAPITISQARHGPWAMASLWFGDVYESRLTCLDRETQLASSLWSPHTSSYQFYFIFNHFLHLCFPSHKPHGQQKLSNVSHQHSTAGSGGSQHITQFQPTPHRQARISRPSRELNTQLSPHWQALCFQTSWDPLQGAHILQILITNLLAIHRTALFHVFYIVYHNACEQTSGPSRTQITLLLRANQIFMLTFEVFRLHPAEPAARNLLTS